MMQEIKSLNEAQSFANNADIDFKILIATLLHSEMENEYLRPYANRRMVQKRCDNEIERIAGTAYFYNLVLIAGARCHEGRGYMDNSISMSKVFTNAENEAACWIVANYVNKMINQQF